MAELSAEGTRTETDLPQFAEKGVIEMEPDPLPLDAVVICL